MSRTIRSYTYRMLAVAGFLSVAGLVAPAAAPAQTISPERALLNPAPIVSYGGVTVAPAPARTLDGGWALLVRSTAGASSQPTLASASLEEAGPVDGERAFLGRFASSEARWLVLAL